MANRTLHQIIQEKKLAAGSLEVVSENPWKLPPMKCPYCSAEFQRPSSLDHHVDYVHG